MGSSRKIRRWLRPLKRTNDNKFLRAASSYLSDNESLSSEDSPKKDVEDLGAFLTDIDMDVNPDHKSLNADLQEELMDFSQCALRAVEMSELRTSKLPFVDAAKGQDSA